MRAGVGEVATGVQAAADRWDVEQTRLPCLRRRTDTPGRGLPALRSQVPVPALVVVVTGCVPGALQRQRQEMALQR